MSKPKHLGNFDPVLEMRMSNKARLTRTRLLTPEEAAKYKEIRAQVEVEFPPLIDLSDHML